jgi:hypothetical protein
MHFKIKNSKTQLEESYFHTIATSSINLHAFKFERYFFRNNDDWTDRRLTHSRLYQNTELDKIYNPADRHPIFKQEKKHLASNNTKSVT